MNLHELEKRNKILERRWKIFLALAILFVITRPVALHIVNNVIHKSSEQAVEQAIIAGNYTCAREKIFKFTSPLLDCDSEDQANIELIPFQDKIRTIQEELTDSGQAEQVSIYFRDLANGPWFGIDENEAYIPASLFKVPIAMSIYKAAETNPSLLDLQVAYDEPLEKEATQTIEPSLTAELGKTYKVSELVENMLIYSDNTSLQLLGIALGDKVNFEQIFKDLAMDRAKDEHGDIQISTRSYASLFRMLYNASYLNKANSEKILSILALSSEEKSLFEGVPKEVGIAAKFGERGYSENKTALLHNCGIIYYPKHPYLLCIMTKGKDPQKLQETIKKASRTIYEEVDGQYKNSSLRYQRPISS